MKEVHRKLSAILIPVTAKYDCAPVATSKPLQHKAFLMVWEDFELGLRLHLCVVVEEDHGMCVGNNFVTSCADSGNFSIVSSQAVGNQRNIGT